MDGVRGSSEENTLAPHETNTHRPVLVRLYIVARKLECAAGAGSREPREKDGTEDKQVRLVAEACLDLGPCRRLRLIRQFFPGAPSRGLHTVDPDLGSREEELRSDVLVQGQGTEGSLGCGQVLERRAPSPLPRSPPAHEELENGVREGQIADVGGHRLEEFEHPTVLVFRRLDE